MLKKISYLFISWRLLLFIPLIFSYILIPYRDGYSYTSVTHFTTENNIINHFLISPWGNFDGINYLLISAEGYTNNAGFFPLFPLLIGFISNFLNNLFPLCNQMIKETCEATNAFIPIRYYTALLLTSIFSFLSLEIFYKLVLFDFKKKIAFSSIIYLLVFPTSFFLVSIYTESLFLFLSLAAFYFARKKQWFLAGISGMLLSATRIVGITIFPALIFEFLYQENKLKQKNYPIIKLLFILLIPLGLIFYSIYNFNQWKDPIYFIKAQGNFLNNRSVEHLVFIPQTLYRYIKIILSFFPSQIEWWIALIELFSFIFASFMIYLAWKKRIRTSYLIFSGLCLLIPASSGTFSGLPRYILILFPIYTALALSKNKKLKILYVLISTALLFIFLILFSKGYFIA